MDVHDGAVFAGETHADVVRQMHAAAWFQPLGKRAYMTEVAERAREMRPGARIAARPARAFLESLVAAGFLAEAAAA